MPKTTRLFQHCLFFYLLVFGILTWMFRTTEIENKDLDLQYNIRKLGYKINYRRNSSNDGSLVTPIPNGGYNKTNQNDSWSEILHGNYLSGDSPLTIVKQTVKLHERPTKYHSVALPNRKSSMTSFHLWKSIRLHPEDKRGFEYGHRYGEPLQLYLDKTAIDTTSKTWPFARQTNKLIDCESLFLEDRNVSERSQWKIIDSIKESYNYSLLKADQSCKEFVRSAGYITEPLTKTEAEFPIAYSILMYTDVEQVEILLRTIYRPQNVYCIHVDKKSPRKLHDDVKTIANCFQNVIVTSYSVDVRWGNFSILEADMLCLTDLWKNKVKWKYFINLTGQDFPLRTNYELVKILMSYNGANNVNAASIMTQFDDATPKRRIPKNRRKDVPPPYKLVPVVGSTHVVLSRKFVDFLLHNETSLAYYNWVKNIYIPDERYFSTMNYNKQLRPPGGYKGKTETTSVMNPHLARLKHWYVSSCHGKIVHQICIFGTKDLPLLATREELFVNKLHFGYHPEVMFCMQELLYNRTADEYEGRLEFNVTYYATRDFVKNKF